LPRGPPRMADPCFLISSAMVYFAR
jgi:hypothetical protein